VRIDCDGAQIPVGRLDALMVQKNLDDQQWVDRCPFSCKLFEPGQHHASERGPELVAGDPNATGRARTSKDVLVGVLLDRRASIANEQRPRR